MYWKPEFDSWDQKFQDIGRSIRLHLLTDKASLCPWPGIQTSQPLHFSISGVDAAARRISGWLDDCCQNHQGSCGIPTATALPTRVLKIEGKERVRLHVSGTKQPTVAKYACLSHCWGGIKPIETKTHTLRSFKSRIPWGRLPRTFQDALELTRQLGLQYLWIDSLCIVQDDEDDWRRESSHMASIYSSAHLTIAATRSPDAHGGLFGGPPPGLEDRVYGFGQGGSAYSVHARQPGHAAFEASELPLLRRAWAFQERLLSPRVAHFADRELYWECLGRAACECGGWAPEKFSTADLVKPSEQPDDGPSREVSSSAGAGPRSLWRRVVRWYCLRSLTYDRDIFPALQGVAKRFQDELGGAYYAGLWGDSLIEDLLWAHRDGTTKGRPYRAPSWSWASNYYPSDVGGKSSESYAREMVWFSERRSSLEAVEEKARVVSVSTEPVDVDPLGELRSATLTLTGRCLRASEKLIQVESMSSMEKMIRGVQDYEQPLEDTRGLVLKRRDGRGRMTEILSIIPPYEWYFDCSLDDCLVKDILLMEIATNHTRSASLAFSKVGPSRPDLFERVGMATIELSKLADSFEEWGEEITLTIV